MLRWTTLQSGWTKRSNLGNERCAESMDEPYRYSNERNWSIRDPRRYTLNNAHWNWYLPGAYAQGTLMGPCRNVFKK